VVGRDPLADVFLCSYGAFPEPAETGLDYAGLLQASIFAAPLIVPDAGEIHVPHPGRDTVATFNCQRIERHYAVRNYWDHPGFYVGQADAFDDLVNFWNLRAADIPLQFFDQRYAARLQPRVTQWAAAVRQSPRPAGPEGLALWHRHELTIEEEIGAFGEGPLTNCAVRAGVWNGMNVHAPVMYFGEAAALASIDQGDRPTISFALTGKPFANDPAAHAQHYVLSIDPGIGLFGNEQATLHAPFIPELNEFYGRNAHFIWNAARAEPGSLGIVETVEAEHLSLRALSTSDLVCRVFEAVGIEAAPSRSGRVATTLIRQMGGLDGCRVFKIAGVRTLIENHRPDQSFDRGTAMQIIKGQGAGRPLSEYQWLYIRARKPGSKLKNVEVLSHLLDKGVFRAGLKFECPSCQLEFWRSLDDSRSRLECEYCGHSFNVSPQLRDKAWAFRRSGLFGNDDHQEGAIPVLLTLQQLMGFHRSGETVYTTAMTLRPKGADIRACETDLVVMTESPGDRRVEIAIGECKTRKPITADDVEKLARVADSFPEDRYDVYIVFARLTPFSPEEVALIRHANGKYRRRAVMLTERELEPYFVYERTAKDFDIRQTASSLADMAAVTVRVFFEERRREAGSESAPKD
jgi:hypothetical protein